MKLSEFVELSQKEMEQIDGGGVWGAVAAGLVGVGVVTLTCVGAPALAAGAAVSLGAFGAKVVVGTIVGLEITGTAIGTVAAYKS